jgi:hypothetical protein
MSRARRHLLAALILVATVTTTTLGPLVDGHRW